MRWESTLRLLHRCYLGHCFLRAIPRCFGRCFFAQHGEGVIHRKDAMVVYRGEKRVGKPFSFALPRPCQSSAYLDNCDIENGAPFA